MNFHLLTPKDWSISALKEANSLVGTTEFETKMAEFRRYTLMAEFMDYIKTLHIANVYHKGSDSFYEAMLVRKLTTDEIIGPEL